MDVSDFIFWLGEGEGGVRGAGAGGGPVFFFLKAPGGGRPAGAEGPGGAEGPEGVCGELGNFGGGGAKYFFSGPKCPPSLELSLSSAF